MLVAGSALMADPAGVARCSARLSADRPLGFVVSDRSVGTEASWYRGSVEFRIAPGNLGAAAGACLRSPQGTLADMARTGTIPRPVRALLTISHAINSNPLGAGAQGPAPSLV